MKKFCLAAVLAATLWPVFGAQGFFGTPSDRVSVGLNISWVADLLMKEDPQISVCARARLSDEFLLKLPFVAVIGRTGKFFDTGLSLVYYPFGTGPFVSLSLVRFGFESPDGLGEQEVIPLNELEAGWTWNFHPSWFAEAVFVIRDPAGAFEREYEKVRGGFPGYKTFRINLLLGWNCVKR